MLQPKTYPRLTGQALVFEPDPFLVMVDDDNPWVEGLFYIVALGVLVGAARVIGGALLTASLPASDALLQAVLQTIQQAQPAGFSSAQLAALQESVRTAWPTLNGLYNYATGWSRLLLLVLTPLLFVAQWLIYGVLAHLLAKLMGGDGTLNQTLGVTALSTAPRALMLVLAVPFSSVGTLLLVTWGVLIAYRGLEIAHDLSIRRAAAAATLPLAVLGILFLVLAGIGGFLLSSIGGLL